MVSVKDKVALVAGAAGEIGQEIALNLAAGGATVALVDQDQKRLDDTLAKLGKAGRGSKCFPADPLEPEQVKAAVDRTLDTFGRINILVNAVEKTPGGEMDVLSFDDWRQTLSGNLTPLFLFNKEVLPKMKDAKFGRVVNLSSIKYLGWPSVSSYSAAKSAVFGFTRALALELARFDVTVNTVVMGEIERPSSGLSAEELEKLSATVPVQRLGQPRDVARAVTFFASDAANYLTGQTLFVCGGQSVYFSMSV